MSANIVAFGGRIERNATSWPKGRKPNAAYRVHEHLTEAEMAKLLAALKAQPAWSPGLADRSADLSARPAGLGGVRSALG